jgi:hypothetical protein
MKLLQSWVLTSLIGDAKTREELEERTRSLDIEKWFENHTPSLTTEADANNGSTDPRAHMRNPYEGLVQARQLSESVDEFLKRLVPSKTIQSPEIPWIRIANPFLPHKKEKTIDDDVLDEGPLLGDSNFQNFIAKGKTVLQELRVAINEVKNLAGLSVEQRYQATCKPREEAVEAVKSAAKEHGVTGGKVWHSIPPSFSGLGSRPIRIANLVSNRLPTVDTARFNRRC